MAQKPVSRPQQLWSSTVVPGWAGPQRDAVDLLKQQGITVPANTPPHVVNDLVRIVSLIWLDGRIVPREQFHIDPADEGLLFGRGLWESTRTFGGLPWLWPLHIERLLNTAKLLEIDVDPQRLPDAQQVHDYVRTLSGSDVVIRLNVTAGWPAMKKPGAVWMTAMLLPKLEPSVRLRSCSTPVPKDEPYLTWKTFQYAGRMRASQEAHKAGFDSALLCDAEDNVLEMSLANIFVRLPDGWATPTATGGLLPGTVRRHLLEKAPLPMRELTIPRRRLAEVTEVFITNSKVGILPVVQIDDQKWPIGAETQELMRWLLPASAAGNSGGPQDRR